MRTEIFLAVTLLLMGLAAFAFVVARFIKFFNGVEPFERASFWRRCVAEGIGTFFFVFVGTGVLVMHRANPSFASGGMVVAAFAISIGLMVQLFGPVSGAHFNPAISMGLFVFRRLDLRTTLGYVGFQVLGASLASLGQAISIRMSKGLFISGVEPFLGEFGLPRVSPTLRGLTADTAMFLESFLTFFLTLGVLGLLYGRIPKIFGGFVVGGFVAVGGLFGGALTGASMNPARAFGPYLMSALNGDRLWEFFVPVYFVGPVIGAILAVFVFRFLFKEDFYSGRSKAPSKAPSARVVEASSVAEPTQGTEGPEATTNSEATSEP